MIITEIFNRAYDLKNAERKAVAEFIEQYRKDLKAEWEELQNKCEHIGHEWRSTGYNINGTVEFFTCSNCLKHKMVDL